MENGTASPSSWKESTPAVARFLVVFSAVVASIAVAQGALDALRDASTRARDARELSWADREVGGGNGVVVDQNAVFEARARIPPDESFEVIVGQPSPSWSEFVVGSVSAWYTWYLIPRRSEEGAPWVLCYGCDLASVGEATVVWQDDEGVSILRRNG
jgi:hypothetical protein